VREISNIGGLSPVCSIHFNQFEEKEIREVEMRQNEPLVVSDSTEFPSFSVVDSLSPSSPFLTTSSSVGMTVLPSLTIFSNLSISNLAFSSKCSFGYSYESVRSVPEVKETRSI